MRTRRHRLQISVAALLGLVACFALNLWLFRVNTLLGIFGVSVSKHVVIAYLCQILGVDRKAAGAPLPVPAPASVPVAR